MEQLLEKFTCWSPEPATCQGKVTTQFKVLPNQNVSQAALQNVTLAIMQNFDKPMNRSII
jgi:hypothetical protein